MQKMLIEHTDELYGRIEQLENQGNGDDGGGRRRRLLACLAIPYAISILCNLE